MVLVLLTSLNCCMSTLCLVRYTLLLTPACWKSNNTNTRLMAFAPSLALDLFADDTAIHSSNSNLRKLLESLQESVNSLLRWAELNHMSLHPDKSIFMLITTRQKRQNLPLKCPPISIGNQTVSEVDNHQILGVTIDCSLSWSSHVTTLCKSISKKIYQLSKIKHFLNFHSDIQSIIDYGSTLWDLANANTLKSLVSLHKRALKAIL